MQLTRQTGLTELMQNLSFVFVFIVKCCNRQKSHQKVKSDVCFHLLKRSIGNDPGEAPEKYSAVRKAAHFVKCNLTIKTVIKEQNIFVVK